jgi:Fe-S-cluster-containing hydrogenase component 2
MPYPYPSGGHPDEIDFREAEEFGREMVLRSRRIHAGETDLIPPTPKMPKKTEDEWFLPTRKSTREDEAKVAEWEREQGLVPISEMMKVWLQFDPEKCMFPKCSLCQDNCPMEGIDMTLDPPVVGKPCSHCMMCAYLCPTGALSENEWAVRAYAEHARGQMETFYLPPLAKAEEEGRFRRLVPVDEIGLDTTVYQKFPQRPLLRIKNGRIETPW